MPKEPKFVTQKEFHAHKKDIAKMLKIAHKKDVKEDKKMIREHHEKAEKIKGHHSTAHHIKAHHSKAHRIVGHHTAEHSEHKKRGRPKKHNPY